MCAGARGHSDTLQFVASVTVMISIHAIHTKVENISKALNFSVPFSASLLAASEPSKWLMCPMVLCIASNHNAWWLQFQQGDQ
jgi:hypothetical protein